MGTSPHSQLLSNFHKFDNAPDAIPRLRRFILDLGVRGKLVNQDPNDEPAAELLKRIVVEKERLVKAKKIRKQKTLPPIEADKLPFEIPDGWEWVRIRQITVDRGQTKPTGDFTCLTVTSINKEAGIIGEPSVVSADSAPSRARKIVAKGDIIYSCVRPYLLNIAIVDRDISPPPIASTAFAILNPMGFTEPRLLWIALRGAVVIEQVETLMRGQAYPAINDSDFSHVILPLPPLAEQKRIVAKVDELMALCDRLEAAQAEGNNQRNRLVAATHHQINSPESDPKAVADFLFHQANFTQHTARPEHIKQLRQTILNLAVRGKLVEPACRQAGKTPSTLPSAESNKWWIYVVECEDGSFYKGYTDNLPRRWKQHCAGTAADWTKAHTPKQVFYWERCGSKETAIKREKYLKSGSGREWFKREVVDSPEAWGPAAELLKRIAAERLELVKQKKVKQALAASDTSIFISKLPTGWQKCSLDDLVIGGPQNGLSPKSTKDENKPKAITLSATTRGVFDDKCFKHVDTELTCDSAFWLQPNDLLFQRGNTREYVGIAAIYEGKPNRFIYPDLIIRVRLSSHVSLSFLHTFMIAPDARAYYSSEASGSSETMPKINQTVLRSCPVLLPPLAEQKRIVAKVTELMALCDALEAQLTSAQTQSQQLLEACLSADLAGLNEAIA